MYQLKVWEFKKVKILLSKAKEIIENEIKGAESPKNHKFSINEDNGD